MIVRADARRLPLRDGCVQTCITSPPYWGLRDYGTPGQIGLEPTPDAYVAALVEVFREVRRVLRDDGTLWLNLGDSYSSMLRSGRNESPGVGAKQEMPRVHTTVKWHAGDGSKFQWRIPAFGSFLKPKDIVGIPWRVAFALQADGWYLRQDIIWHKPNPMPESVTDRCTKAHEYVFLLAKSQRYYWDAAAVMEPVSADMARRALMGHTRGARGKLDASRCDAETLRGNHAKHISNSPRNRRSVWTVTTEPYPGAHYAVMPTGLVEPMVLAGAPMGGLVLDPFCGTGTVLEVAQRLGRVGVGCDLAYQHLSKERTAQRGLRWELFA